MSFNSMLFLWLFLPLCLAVYWLCHGRGRKAALLGLSLFYWAWNDPYHVIIVLAVCLVIYGLARQMAKAAGNSRRAWLGAGVVLSLGMLVFCRYAPLMDGAKPWLLVPAGISFISFSLVSFLMDLYRGQTEFPVSPADFIIYIAFFPKLLMGPIASARDFSAAVSEEKQFAAEQFAGGVRQYAFGLGKKVLIADVLALVVKRTFGDIAALTTGAAWVGALCYMLQIYYDFSGYSDMALGISRMLGIELKKNFDYPYLSGSITEFWRRWHISLGTWFRQYLYIPLGGNRKGQARTYFNLMMVFLATGIWHGTGMNYLLWGVLNGVLVVIERMGLLHLLEKSQLAGRFYAGFAVLMGWVLFRAENAAAALAYYRKMFLPCTGTLTAAQLLQPKVILLMFLGFAGSGFLQESLSRLTGKKSSGLDHAVNFIVVILLALSIMGMVSGTFQSFIYAQF